MVSKKQGEEKSSAAGQGFFEHEDEGLEHLAQTAPCLEALAMAEQGLGSCQLPKDLPCSAWSVVGTARGAQEYPDHPHVLLLPKHVRESVDLCETDL